jgi:tetratricopeptide (TPR) repeat protein
MKMLSTTALGFALALGATTAATPAFAKEKEAAKPAAMQLSPKVRTGAVAAQAAIAKSDWAGAKAAIDTAEPEIKTPDDKFILGQLTLQVAQKGGMQDLFPKAVNMMIDSGKAPPEMVGQLQMVKAKMAYQAKDYATAETALLAAQAAGSTDADLIPVLVSSQHEQGKDLVALQSLTATIDKQVAANQPVPEAWYQRGIAIGYGAKASPDKAALQAITADLAKKWVSAYPTKSNWRDSLIIYRDSAKLDPDTEIDLYRLLYSTGGMKGERDYMDYVLATYLRYPGEALMVLNAGTSSGQVNPAGKNATEIKGIVSAKVPADKASLAGADKSAAAAANGKIALNTADAFLGYGEWAKAVAMYKLALQKGGVDANVVNVRLGMALAKSGDAAGAKAAFAAVTGPRKALADLWTVFVDHPPTA